MTNSVILEGPQAFKNTQIIYLTRQTAISSALRHPRQLAKSALPRPPTAGAGRGGPRRAKTKTRFAGNKDLMCSFSEKNDQCIKAHLSAWFPDAFEQHNSLASVLQVVGD